MIVAHRLTSTELTYRQSDRFKSAFDLVHRNSVIPSFLREKYTLFFSDLKERLKVDVSILDYNYTRLNRCMTLLMYEQTQVFKYRFEDIPRIEEKEYPLALEFFLQFDGKKHS